MLSRDQLRKTKCWGCWWQEGGRCYNKDIAEVIQKGDIQRGQEITRVFVKTCSSENRKSKRSVLAPYFDSEELVIVSEASDLSEE